MPIVIRKPGHDIFAGSYRFPAKSNAVENYPWLCARRNDSLGLCDTCSCLNFDWLFNHSLYEFRGSDGEVTANISDGICLGSYVDITSRASCKICKLLLHALETGADYEMLLERDMWEERDIYIMNYAYSSSGIAMSPDSKKSEYIMRLGVQLKKFDEFDSILSFGTRTIMIQKIERGILYGGLTLSSSPTNLTQTIQQWLGSCKQVQPNDGKVIVRLIDVSKRCVTEPTPLRAQDYVALSYTWGRIDPLTLTRSNLDELALDGALERLSARVPGTIRDAIQLCRMLELRYLWVDSLCIVQDGDDKGEQIQLMDLIYENATLTIVAAAGSDGNAGLPGISTERKPHQKIVDVHGLALANVLPHLEHSLAHSVWQSRGWTFQEGLLSSRKLIFTQDQVYYHCAHGECNEDTKGELHESATVLAPRDIPLRLAFENVSNWTVYRNVVAEFCKRELSYENDVLNAFAGIAAHLSRNIFLNSPFLAGMPLCSLEGGMLWQPTGRLRRRRNLETGRAIFPSWSWAGWDGPMEYANAIDFDNTFERSISHLDLSAERGEHSKGEVRFEKWERRVDDAMDEIYYVHEDHSESLWFAHPIKVYNFPEGFKRKSDLEIDPLRVVADVAQLTLTGQHADTWYQGNNCHEGHLRCWLQVLDSHGRKAGNVVMDGATFDSTDFSDPLFHSVKISQSTLAPGQDDPSWSDVSKSYLGKPGEPPLRPRPPFDSDEEEFDQTVYDPNICWCLYNVLVVKFTEEDVAERIAVGQVHIHAFDNANPVRRELLLG